MVIIGLPLKVMKFITFALFAAVVSSATVTDTINSTDTLTLTTCSGNNSTITHSNSTSVISSFTISKIPSVSKADASQMKFVGIAAVLAGALLAL